jgi:hypothetical protein
VRGSSSSRNPFTCTGLSRVHSGSVSPLSEAQANSHTPRESEMRYASPAHLDTHVKCEFISSIMHALTVSFEETED